MAASGSNDLLSDLRALVASATSKERVLCQQEADVLVDAIRAVLENGFKGSRAVRGHIWNLVVTSGRAFPVLMHPSIAKVKAVARQEGLDDDRKFHLWVQEALHQGVLCPLIRKIPTQYHIISAYSSDAAMCIDAVRTEFETLLIQLKGLPPALPDIDTHPSVSSMENSASDVMSPPSSEHHTDSLPGTPHKQMIPETKIKRKRSLGGLNIPWIDTEGNRKDENPVRLMLHVAKHPEAGEVVKANIVVSHHVGWFQNAFIADMTQGFNNALETIVRRQSATLDAKSARGCPQEAQGGANASGSKQGEGNLGKHPSFKNVWGDIVKPFTKHAKVKSPNVKGSHTSGCSATLSMEDAGVADDERQEVTGKMEAPEESGTGLDGSQKNNLPEWMKQPGLAFLAPVLGHKPGRMNEADLGLLEAKDTKSKGELWALETKRRSDKFFQNMFRKSARKPNQVEEQEEESLGQELGIVAKKDPGPQCSIEELEAELLTGDPLMYTISSQGSQFLLRQLPSPTSSTSTPTGAIDWPEPLPTSTSNEKTLEEGLELVHDVQSACERTLKEAEAGGGVIGNDCNAVMDLCQSIESVLSFSMSTRPRPWRPGAAAGLKFFTDIADMIPKGRKSPFMVLRNAQRMFSGDGELPGGLGVDVVEGMVAVVGDRPQLYAWLRSSLNAQCLEKRFQAILAMDQLWGGWYDEGSLMHSEESRGALAYALRGLDGVRCLLAVDKWTGEEEGKRMWGQPPARFAPVMASEASTVHTSVPGSTEASSPTTIKRTITKTQSSKSFRQKKRVVDFGAEASALSPLSTPELSPLPANYFECAEPLSPTALAQALGMDASESFEPHLTEAERIMEGILPGQTSALPSPIGGIGEDREVMAVDHTGGLGEDKNVSADEPDMPGAPLHTTLSLQIDNFLGETSMVRDDIVGKTRDSSGIRSCGVVSDVPLAYVNFEQEDTIGDDEQDDAATSSECLGVEDENGGGGDLGTMSEDADTNEVAWSEDSSSDGIGSHKDLSSCAAEDAIQEAIDLAQKQISYDWVERDYLPASLLSLGEEELELLEPSDLGVSAADLAAGMHTYISSASGNLGTPKDKNDVQDKSSDIPNNTNETPAAPGSSDDANGVRQDASLPTGADADCWDGVWKDVDVLRAETVDEGSGTHTVYVIELTASNGSSWQVSRRFRDIVALRKRIKKREGVVLPRSWDNVKQSRHITGSSRLSLEIIDARNALMRQCLWDLRSAYTNCMGWPEVASFLDAPLHILKGVKVRKGTTTTDEAVVVKNTPQDGLGLALGNILRLLVDLHPEKTDEELLAAQSGKCAGCHSALRPAAPAKGLSSYLRMTQRSSGPRKCEYTNLLYCHDCHNNSMETIPARVLHTWDFTEKPVSDASKEYLVSIKTKPVLCLGTVNPGLFARVPLLANVQSLRQKVILTLSVVKGAGAEGKAMAERVISEAGVNGHLLESPDFWSLRDLTDISKGSAFSSLPRWLESVSGRVGRLATSAVLKYEYDG